MSIIYAVVARNASVLSEHSLSGVSGNFGDIARTLLKKLPMLDGRSSYVHEK